MGVLDVKGEFAEYRVLRFRYDDDRFSHPAPWVSGGGGAAARLSSAIKESRCSRFLQTFSPLWRTLTFGAEALGVPTPYCIDFCVRLPHRCLPTSDICAGDL